MQENVCTGNKGAKGSAGTQVEEDEGGVSWHQKCSESGHKFIQLWEWTWCHCIFYVRTEMSALLSGCRIILVQLQKGALQMLYVHVEPPYSGALHTGTETGFTGSGSPIRIQCRLSCELHTARRLRALHCWTGSHALSRSTARSTDPDWGRVEAKWSLDQDPRSASDPEPRSRVESLDVRSIIKVRRSSAL